MNKILTIVIPSYNVEKFLNQTLDSFIDEKILSDIEVLIVDDGSKDCTVAIGKTYEGRYPQTFRVISKVNGGHGSTINRGIEEASGAYFKVVDGDDWVNTEDFVIFVERLKSCSADYVVTNYYEVYENTREEKAKNFPMLKEAKRGRYFNFDDIADKVQLPMHALVIKTKILQEHNIRLDEHCFYVDVEYILYPIPYVHTIVYFDLYIYMYRLAQQTQSVSIQGYQKHIQNHMDVIMNLTRFADKYKKHSSNTKKVDYIGKRIAQMIGDQITIFMSYPVKNKEIKEKFMAFDQELNKHSEWIYQLSAKESGTLSLLRKTGFMGYRWIMQMGKKRNQMEG